MDPNLSTLLITLVTVLTSTAAWRFWEHRARAQEKTEDREHLDELQYRNDLRERVRMLELMLKDMQRENTTLRDELRQLTATVATQAARIQWLERENKQLKNPQV